MQKIAIICGDTASYSTDQASLGTAHAFAEAAKHYGEVHTFNVKDGLDIPWSQATNFTAIVPLLYPLSADEAAVLRELEKQKVSHLFSTHFTYTILTDRVHMKEALLAARVRTPAYHVVENAKSKLQFPATLHALSTPPTGIWLATTQKEFVDILPAVQKFSNQVMAERRYPGLRYCVSVIEDTQRGVRALPPVFLRDIPDDERKHFDDPYTEAICPTNLSSELRHRLQDEAIRAHAAIAARNFSHSQFTVDNSGNCWLTDITHSLVGNDTLHYELMPALNAAHIEFADMVRAWLSEPSPT